MDEESSSIDQFLSKYKGPLIFSLVGFVLLIEGLMQSGIFTKTFFKPSSQTNSSFKNTAPKSVKVDVSGVVSNPGVYSLTYGSRIEDTIKAAGGISTNVDQ